MSFNPRRNRYGRRRGGGRGNPNACGRGQRRGRQGGPQGGPGRGRGNRGGGWFRGRGRSRGGGSSEEKVSMRWHEQASAELQQLVHSRNLQDNHGRQLVRFYRFPNSEWIEVESLSKGGTYFVNPHSGERKSSRPASLRNVEPCGLDFMDQGVNFPHPPQRSSYPTSMKRHIISNIVTNTFRIEGNILDAPVHMYDVVFNPPVPGNEVEQRRTIVLGDKNTARENARKLASHFRNFEFDNTSLYVLGAQPAPIVTIELSGFTVTFQYTTSYYLRNNDIPLEQQSQLLNIFNRKRMFMSGYRRINRSWFSRRPKNNPDPVDKAAIIYGFDCSMQITPNNSSEEIQMDALFKGDLAHKLVSSQSVHEMMTKVQERSRSEAEFHSQCQDMLIGKYFVMTYNSQNLPIVSIDWNQNEHSHFELRSKGRITYAEYLEDTYDIQSPKTEFGVVVDRNGSCYLTQHMRLTMNSSEAKYEYKNVLQRIEAPTPKRFERVYGLVHQVNTTASKKMRAEARRADRDATDEKKQNALDLTFRVNPTGLTTDALLLQYPNITFMGNREPITQRADALQWRDTNGFLEYRPLRSWGIVYHRKPRRRRPNEEELEQIFAKEIVGKYNLYMSKRGLPRDVFGEPRLVGINLMDSRTYGDAIDGSWGVVMVIIPNTKDGSRIKAFFTKYVSRARARNPIMTQFILEENCRRVPAVLGAFEDMLEKWGNVLFRVTPKFGTKNPAINIKRTWTFGIDVSHVAKKPSVAMLHLNRTPLDGSLGSSHLVASLNKERQEIIPFVAMVAMTEQILNEAFEALERNARQLPDNIIVYRDGVGDGELRELNSKEVSGIQRGIRMFQEQHGLKSRWHPKIEFICVPKIILDRFGRGNGRVVDDICDPIVVFDGVTNHRIWDFIMFPYHPNKRNCRNKRYIVLKDGMGLNENGAWDLYQYTFALTYAFCFAIPFPLGGGAQPAPIAYAKHYAQLFSPTILTSDRDTDDLAFAEHLIRPHIVDEGLLDADRLFDPDIPIAPIRRVPEARSVMSEGEDSNNGVAA